MTDLDLAKLRAVIEASLKLDPYQCGPCAFVPQMQVRTDYDRTITRAVVIRLLDQLEHHRETLRRMHGWLRLAVESGRTDGQDSALRSLEATEPWLFEDDNA